MQELRTKRHVVFSLHLHLVFMTKYRRKVFSEEIYERLLESLPHTTPSRLVNRLKGVSSRMLRQESPELEHYYWKGGLWSPSYFIASCGGGPLDIVMEYIQNRRCALISSP